MMLSNCMPKVIAAAMVTALGAAGSAEAQIVIGRGGGGISVSVPGLGGIRLGAPIRAYGVPGRAIVGPYGDVAAYGYRYGDPNYPSAYGPVSRYAARPIASTGYGAMQSLPTAGELRAMTDSELLNAVISLTAQLDEDLNRFDTGNTWQNYLRLPEDALPPATEDGRVRLGRASLSETLKRFDRTIANPRYVQISGLPSFAAAHSALGEVIRRFGSEDTGAAPVEPALTRSPPVPTPDSPLARPDLPGGRTESLEMQNLRSARARSLPSDSAVVSEELPVPPPSLVAPQNSSEHKRSILAD